MLKPQLTGSVEVSSGGLRFGLIGAVLLARGLVAIAAMAVPVASAGMVLAIAGMTLAVLTPAPLAKHGRRRLRRGSRHRRLR